MAPTLPVPEMLPPPEPEEPPPYVSPPEDFETRCRKAGPARVPLERRLWTADLCANVVFSHKVRSADQYPGYSELPRRRNEFLSVRPIRAKGWGIPNNVTEVCHNHWGRLVKFPDNRWRVVFCTRPAIGRHVFSVGRFFREPKERTEGDPTGIKPGRWGVTAVYNTPLWTEAHLHSHQRVCAPPVG
jgi:hypothetical protein